MGEISLWNMHQRRLFVAAAARDQSLMKGLDLKGALPVVAAVLEANVVVKVARVEEAIGSAKDGKIPVEMPSNMPLRKMRTYHQRRMTQSEDPRIQTKADTGE
jgi:hypothetical protein